MTGSAMGDSLSRTFYDDLKPDLHRRIAAALRGARTVVDLGCGSCGLAFFLAESNQQHVIGVDISGADFPGQTNAAGHGPGNVECVREDAKTLTFLDAGSVDAVVSVWALHEMASPVSVLCEAIRILRPGGRALIVDFPRNSLAQQLWNENYFEPEEMAEMLRKAGFTAIHCKLLSDGQIIWASAEKEEADARPEDAVKQRTAGEVRVR